MGKDSKKKKNLLLGGLAIGGAGLCLLFGIKHPKAYTRKWIEGLSDIEWTKEREKVQTMLLDPTLDVDFREKCRKVLLIFDRVKSARDWAGQNPCAPSYPREHGHNLWKPE